MKILMLAASLLVSLCGYPQATLTSFVLNGDISGIRERSATVYYHYAVNGRAIQDSVKVKDGRFTIKGRISEAVLAGLQVKYAAENPHTQPDFQRDFLAVYIDKGTMNMRSTERFSNARVTGSAAHEAYTILNEKEATYIRSRNELFKKMQQLNVEKDSTALTLVEEQVKKLNQEIEDEVYRKFIQENPNSPIVFHVMDRLAGWKMDADKMEPLCNMIGMQQKSTWSGQAFQKRLQAAALTRIGAKAPDLVQPDTSGKMIALSAFKGRFLLLDFWASWCFPCRQENPNLVEVYKSYKEKGFEILSVSLDKSGQRSSWIAAIRQDRMNWTNVSELNEFNSSAAQQYGIVAIPRNFLINPEGIIIAADLRGPDLGKNLAEIFNKRS
jgi:peroxiredoxin